MDDFFEISNPKVEPEEFISANSVLIKQEPDLENKNLQEWKTSNKCLEIKSIKVDCGNRYIDEQDDSKDQVSFANRPGDGHKTTTHTDFMQEENTESKAAEIKQEEDLKGNEKFKCIQCRFCEYKTKNKYVLVRHFMVKHDETAEWLQCQFCDYRSKVETNLKKHLYYSHNDNIKWHACQSCEFKTKRRARLIDHENYKHNANAEWLQCSFCDYKTKLKTTFRQHVRYKHGADLAWHYCKSCEYKTKYRSNLFKHHNIKHAENVEHYYCEDCDYKTKIKGHLTRHHKSKHEGNVEWHHCQVCGYKTKIMTKLSRHMKLNHVKGIDNVVTPKQNKELVSRKGYRLESLEDEVMSSIREDLGEQMTITCDTVDDKTDDDNDCMQENIIEFVKCEKNIEEEDESSPFIIQCN